jgi:ABC-type phosphate transport system substrate-binding protein
MLELTQGRGTALRRGALFTCVLALLAALGVLHAAGASALGEQCSGSQAKGMGAFLQTRAQQEWSGSESGFNASSNPLACSGSQGSGGAPKVSYVPLASSAALRHWGAEDGSLHVSGFGFLANFVATDIAPSGPVGEEGSMLAKMKGALGSDLAVVPVTQTAIAIAAHPPALPAHAPCVVSRITSAQLEKVFSGEIKNWRKLGAASDPTLGGDCDQAITRIVRDESSGTTYQFKHYLNSIDPAPLACTGKAKRTWAQLQAPFGGETSPNQEWPRKADCQEGEGSVTTVSGPIAEGGGGPLSYVRDTPGTITYGSLPEAQQQASKQVIDVHNGVKFASPENNEGGASCGAAKYTRPAGWEGGVNVDWSQVYGSNPNIGEVAKNAYPICTLSWDVAATDRFTEKAATTVHDYLAFAVDKEGGQAAVRHLGYHDLPASIAKAANAAIAHINGEESEEEGGGEEEEGGEEEGGEEEGGEEEGGEEEGGEEEGGGGSTGTVLCSAEPTLIEGVLTCPKGQGFSGAVFGGLKPETVATFESLSGPEATVTCTEGFFAGEFNENGTGISGGISGFHFGAEEPCTSTFPEGPAVNVAFENPPYYASRFVYTSASAPEGFFELARKDKAPPRLRVQSPIWGTLVCVYAPNGLSFQVDNGSPTEMLMSGKWKLLEESPKGVCPTVLAGSADLSIGRTSEQLPLYVAGK